MPKGTAKRISGGFRNHVTVQFAQDPDVRAPAHHKYSELHGIEPCAILVALTNFTLVLSMPSPNPRAPTLPGHWQLQDAKARFSELVRRARSEGPQRVSVHGRDEVVIIAAEEYRRLSGSQSGRVLIQAIQASPYREIQIEPSRRPMPVREVSL